MLSRLYSPRLERQIVVVHRRQLQLLLPLVLVGCQLDLPGVNSDILPVDDDGNGPSDADAAGDDSVSDDNTPTGPDACGADEHTCGDGDCVPIGEECDGDCNDDVCAALDSDNASFSCGDNGCDEMVCNTGFFDCDGELSNGCEASFTGLAGGNGEPPPALEAHRLDDDFDFDFTGFPQYEIRVRCPECDFPNLPPLGDNLSPAPDDLSAVFSLGWTPEDGLVVRLRVRDDAIIARDYDQGADPPQEPAFTPLFQDNLEIVYLGADDNTQDDEHTFVNYLGQAQPDTDNAVFGLIVQQPVQLPSSGCFEMTLVLGGNYLSGSEEQPLVPEEGNVFSFGLAINDVDPVAGDGGADPVEERQNHLFYRNPGAGYWFSIPERPNRIGTVTLMGPITDP